MTGNEVGMVVGALGITSIVMGVAGALWHKASHLGRQKITLEQVRVADGQTYHLRVHLAYGGTTWDAPADTPTDWYRAVATDCGALHVLRYHPMGAVVVQGWAAGQWLSWEKIWKREEITR